MTRPFQDGSGDSDRFLGAIGARADRGVAARVERLQRRGGVVDLDDLADLDAVADIDADAFAESQKARQAGDPIVRHRHLGDDAADARRLEIAQAPGDPPLQALERGNGLRAGCGIDHEADPSVLMASCSDPSDCEASAATPSKARVTSISRVISRTGSTFELSTAP